MHTNITVTKLPKSEVEITGTFPFEALEKHKKAALKHIGKHVSIDGFRAGHIPEKVLVNHVGAQAILEEMAEMTLSENYPTILAEKQIFPLSRPKVVFTKLAEGNPFEFKITVAVMPEVTVGDYKKIAASENKKPLESFDATEKEIEELLMTIRKSHVDHSKHDHSVPKEEHDKLLEKEAPELTDEFAKKVGFADVADLRAKVKENIIKEKEYKTKEKKRLAIIDEVIKTATIDVPEVLIENELDKMTDQFSADIARMGATLEDYLKHIKKTNEDMRADWRADAIQRVKLQLVLGKIASLEKIEADKAEVNKEVAHITSHYKDADPERARDYAETILRNEKVFQFLESQK